TTANRFVAMADFTSDAVRHRAASLGAARRIFVSIANSPTTEFRAASIVKGAGDLCGGFSSAVRGPIAVGFSGGENSAKNPPTKDPDLAFSRSRWPASSPFRKSDTTSADGDL